MVPAKRTGRRRIENTAVVFMVTSPAIPSGRHHLNSDTYQKGARLMEYTAPSSETAISACIVARRDATEPPRATRRDTHALPSASAARFTSRTVLKA